MGYNQDIAVGGLNTLPSRTRKKILVIRHAALGELINATGAFAAIREAHPHAHVTLLTAPSYATLATKMGFFDDIWHDARAKNPLKTWQVIARIGRAHFDFVYDLQNSGRTSRYFRLLSFFGRPLWSGVAKGASHTQTRPDRTRMHAAYRYLDQLTVAGLDLGAAPLLPDLKWMAEDVSALSLPKRYVLLMPGSSLSGSYKRWPHESYAEMAGWLASQGITSILIAGPEDETPASYLRVHVDGLVDLSQKVSLFQIATLARGAVAVIGNDTGPTHIASGVGAKTIVPWSRAASDPDIYAPLGDHVRVVAASDMANLSLEAVKQAFLSLVPQNELDSKGDSLASSTR